jgi:hypothetical protein
MIENQLTGVSSGSLIKFKSGEGVSGPLCDGQERQFCRRSKWCALIRATEFPPPQPCTFVQSFPPSSNKTVKKPNLLRSISTFRVTFIFS